MIMITNPAAARECGSTRKPVLARGPGTLEVRFERAVASFPVAIRKAPRGALESTPLSLQLIRAVGDEPDAGPASSRTTTILALRFPGAKWHPRHD